MSKNIFQTLLKGFLSLLIIFLSGITLSAQEVLELKDGQDEYSIKASHMQVLEDKDQELTLNEILSRNLPFSGAGKDRIPFNKNQSSAYWIKFSVKNVSKKFRAYFIESHAPQTDLTEVFIPDGKGGYIKEKGGTSIPFHDRVYVNKNLIFDLPVNQDSSVTTCYIRVVSRNFSQFNFHIKSVNYFIYYITNEYYFLGIYYGILLIMALYNLMMYISIREKVYLYYVFYVLSGILITMSEDGLGIQYLYPQYPALNRFVGYNAGPILYMISFIIYSTGFLDLHTRFPKLRRILFSVTGVYLVYFVLSNIIEGSAQPAVYTVPFITAYIIAAYTFFKGYKPSRFYIIGYTVIFVSILIIQLRAAHIIVYDNIFTVYSFNFGLMLEVVIFSFALSDKIKLIKREKEEAQEEVIQKLEENKILQSKVNRELEEKVSERTAQLKSKSDELESANVMLKELNDKINEMNARLDYDNWYLKKDLKESLQARVMENDVTREDFMNIFPDSTTCFRYLEKMKWENGFVCRKCGNTKYTNISKPFMRKCSRCGHIESVMAYTVYHGVRFPIEKAFYITYLVHKKGNNVSLTELSELLGLRRNTCWKFKNKILSQMEVMKKKTRKETIERWEDLIM